MDCVVALLYILLYKYKLYYIFYFGSQKRIFIANWIILLNIKIAIFYDYQVRVS